MIVGVEKIILPVNGQQHDSSENNLLLFFITGNPGLIEYYRSFLTLCYDGLRDSLDCSNGNITLHVYGTSLAGFESNHTANTKGPYDLNQQIEHIEASLSQAIVSVKQRTQTTRVILIGHSVGAYILLEVLRRHQAAQRISTAASPTSRIIGGICLFPTVVDLAKSSNGKMFRVRLSSFESVIVCRLIESITSTFPSSPTCPFS